ncbi:MAG TPA: glycoside hydrolase family 20 zincin-like fold domain-containing protein [Anaerolineaceae bacterium]
MDRNMFFLPVPRRVIYLDGDFALGDQAMILIDHPEPQQVLFTAKRLQSALETSAGKHWEITASKAVPADQVGVTLKLSLERVHRSQGYHIEVTGNGIVIEGRDIAGLFYGVCTLGQILTQVEGTVPCLEIHDFPDYKTRGVMLDISRNKVYKMETLLDLVDRLAGLKINQLQLYTEHTFAYRNHPSVWEYASPMTGEEILKLDHYCRERQIELVPNQNSFGHMQPWLSKPKYAHLAEIHGEFESKWGKRQGPFSLSPIHPGTLPFLRSLYDELLPHFSSKMFNIGCDETIDLGKGMSKAACEKEGIGRVYLNFLLALYEEVKRRGYTPQFWGDIINEHPALVAELPKDMISLLWGYEADHPFDLEGSRFQSAGIPFYVCPGTSSWCSISGRTQNCIGNLLNAAENGLKYGAQGYLNTDWGDRGHWQVLPISFLGFGLGSAFSWCLKTNRSIDIPEVISRFLFEDPMGAMGRLVYDLGNIDRMAGVKIHNGTSLFWTMQTPLDQITTDLRIGGSNYPAQLEAIDQAIQAVLSERMQRKDAALIRREIANTVRLLRHACGRGMLAGETNPHQAERMRQELARDMSEFLEEYREIWLARNRPGGLADSAARFEARLEEYRQ